MYDMKLRKTTVALSAALTLGMIGHSTEVAPSTVFGESSVSASPNADNADMHQTAHDGRPIIDVRKLNRPIPQKVKKAIGAAAFIRVDAAGGSGVRIGNNEYLTAGHMFKDSGNNYSAKEGCGPADIVLPSGDGAFATQLDTLTATRREPTRASAETSWRDISVMTSTEQSDGPIAPIAPRNQDLKTGTPLTFANYEPTGSGSLRTPQNTGDLHSPAVFDGVVLQDSRGDGSQIAVLTGVGVSYNHPSDRILRPGSSGGEAVSDDGVVRGLVTAVEGDGQGHISFRDVDDVEKEFHVDIVGEKTDEVQIGYVQPVNKQLVQGLGGLASVAEVCPAQ